MQCSCKPDAECKSTIADDADLHLLNDVFEHYREQKGSLVTVLQKAQEIYSYLPTNVLYLIAREMNVKPSVVYGVATFYTQFRLKPVGKNVILLCQGTACHVNGAERLETAIAQELKIKPGETTEDRLFTLQSVACLGCCSLAPVMMINGQAYGPLTTDSAVKIIRGIRKAEGASEDGGDADED